MFSTLVTFFLEIHVCLAACSFGVPTDSLEAAHVRESRVASTLSPAHAIHADEIQAHGYQSLHESLSTLPGLSIKDYGGLGGLKTVSFRNMGAHHSSISYDGVLLSNTQSGQLDISTINLTNVQAIHTTIGQPESIFQSAQTFASAGTVSFHSKRPTFQNNPFNISAKLTNSSFHTFNPSISYEQKISSFLASSLYVDFLTSKGDYPFTLTNGSITTKEARLNSDIQSLRTEFNLFGTLGSHLFTFKTLYANSNRGLPGPVIYYTQDPTERLQESTLLFTLKHDYSSTAFRTRTSLSYNRGTTYYTDSSHLYQAPISDLYTQNNLTLSHTSQYTRSIYKVSLAQDLVYANLYSNIPSNPNPARLSSYTALSLLLTHNNFTLSSTILATAIREHSSIKTFNRFKVTPSIAISYQATSTLSTRLSYRNGYRVPTFNDLYYDRVGNISLVPETAHQLNAGILHQYTHNNLTLSSSIDIYANFVKDKIVAIPSMFIWKMKNVGRAFLTGADLSTRIAWTNSFCPLTLNLSYSYQYAVNITDKQSKNYRHQLPYVPQHTASASIISKFPWFTLSPTIQFVGSRYFLYQNTLQNLMPAYVDLGLSLNRTFKIKNTRLHLSAKLLNLLNNNYEVIRFYPMPGFNYRISTKLTF